MPDEDEVTTAVTGLANQIKAVAEMNETDPVEFAERIVQELKDQAE